MRVFTTLHWHIVLISPKITLAMLVNIHSSLEGKMSQEMEDDAEFLKAEGTIVSISAGRRPQDFPIRFLYE